MASLEGVRRAKLNRLYAKYGEEPALAGALASSRVVCGSGPTYPRFMFVGEAPGANEERLGKPFIGASGALLNDMLASIGLDRDTVFITNAVKVRPTTSGGSNRPPTEEELAASVPYLRREHSILGCPPLVLLGKHARMAAGQMAEGAMRTGNPARTMKVGEWSMALGFPALPLHHPAFGIYQQSNRPMMFEMFKAVLTPPEFPHAAIR